MSRGRRRVIIAAVLIICSGVGVVSMLRDDQGQTQETVGTHPQLENGSHQSSEPDPHSADVEHEHFGTDAGLGPEPQKSSTPAEWDDAAVEEAVTTATTAVELYTREDLPPHEWWEQFSVLLTPNAQSLYTVVGRTYAPDLTITGPGHIIDQRTPLLTTVELPTDQGPYLVLVTRENGDSPWLVERLPDASLS